MLSQAIEAGSKRAYRIDVRFSVQHFFSLSPGGEREGTAKGPFVPRPRDLAQQADRANYIRQITRKVRYDLSNEEH